MKQLLTALMIITVSGCGGAVERPPDLYDEGDPCRSPYHFCIDEESAMRCEANVWRPVSCELICAELGPAYLAAGCDEDCVCVLADPSACTPGESTCVDEAHVGVCSDQQEWETSSCAELCAATQLEPLGCEPGDMEEEEEPAPWAVPASCWCTAEGTACDMDAPPTCVDEATVALCTEGIWLFVDCAISCGGPAQCDPWQTPAGCAC